MTDHSDSRSLLLERLESRCMLAAGLFAHSVDHDGDLNHRSDGSERDASGGQHSAEIGRVGETGNRDHRPARDSQHRNQVDHGRADRNSSLVSSQPLSSPPQQQSFGGPNLIDNGFQPLEIQQQESQLSTPVVSSAAASTTNPPPTNVSQGNTIQSEASVAADESAEASRGAVLTAISAPVASDSSVATTDRVFDIAPDLDVMESASEAFSFDADRTGDVDRFIDQSSSDLASDASSTWDGLIDPQLGLHSEWLRQESSADEATWEIRGETIDQLRDLAADPSVEQVGDSNKLTDEVIATWFEGAGGLVDIGSGKLGFADSLMAGETNLSIHSGDFVGIVLDATVGLHRSVNLISGEVESSDSPVRDGEAVRDAVLAAIAGEASNPVSPIGGEARPKLSSIAYPGAVILASTLAIVGRRKTVKLFNRTRSRSIASVSRDA